MGWLQLGSLTSSRGAAPLRQSHTAASVLLGKEGTVATHLEHAEPVDVHSKNSNDFNSSSQPPPPPPALESPKQYPCQPEHLRDDELPTIPASEVTSKRRSGLTVSRRDKLDNKDLWIVIDNVVYDCSTFIDDHPGGRQVIASFLGEDCSWQFWRFHSESLMQKYGQPLRIGRTSGVENRFREAPRWVGLRRLGGDD